VLFIFPLIQKSEAQVIKGEVFLGGNISQVDGDECFGYKKTGFQGGAGALIPITNFMDLGLEVLYNQKGAIKKDSITYNSSFAGSYRLNLNYVEVPVLIYLTDKEKVSVGIGASYGRLVGLKEEINGQSTGISIGNGKVLGEGLNSNSYNGNDISILADLRVRIYEGLHLELRYQYSMFKIRERQFYENFTETLPSELRNQYNNELSLRAVYIFNEKRSAANKKEQKQPMPY
jgi:hypothetical protein